MVIKQHILWGSYAQPDVVKVVGVKVGWMHTFGVGVGVVMINAGGDVAVGGTDNVMPVLGLNVAETEPRK